MDNRRNSKRPTTFNFFKSSNKVGQKFKRKETVYTDSARRSKKSRFSSPEKQSGVKKISMETKISDKNKDDIPDRSYGDYYCKACDSHMSSEQTFECHVQGKRHLRNTSRKGPESEYEYVDQDPIMLPEIKKVKKPIVGLQHCCEMVRSDGKPTYQCFLCSVSIPNSQLLIEHIVGLKHRMAYLKIHDSVNYGVITKADLKKGMIEPVVEEFIQKYQNKHGLGKMRVKVAKSTSSSYNSPGRPCKDDLIYKKNKNFGRNSYDDDNDEDVRSDSKSDNSDWRYNKNSYNDVRNESKSQDSDWKHLKISYDDVRNESKSEEDDDDVINESIPESSDWKHSRKSYNDFRNGFKTENSNWRQVSGEDIDYHSKDQYASELHFEKSVAQQEQFNQIETIYTDRRSLTPKSQSSNMNYEETERDVYSNLTWNVLDQTSQSEDLRVFLEKKRMMESLNTSAAPTVPSNTNSLESISSLIEEMPTMKFLELVLQKVEKIDDPSEAEVNMLSKIGKHMFKIVMKKKMGMLTPDLQKKYQSVTEDSVNQPTLVRTATPDQKSTNKYDFQSLMELIKNPRRESEKPVVNYNFPPQNISPQLGVASTSNHQPTYTTESLNFMNNFLQTPSTLPTSSMRDFPAIPGLTWSGSQGISTFNPYSYPQNLSHQHNVWGTLQYEDNLN